MMPGVGLYLPETLHRKDVATLDKSRTGERMPEYTHRAGQRASQDTTSTSLSERSVDQKSDASNITSRVCNPTTTAFEYADFVFSLNKRSAEAEKFASLIWRTRQDLAEASRLYLSSIVTNFLDTWPNRKSWIDKALSDVRASLVDIGYDIESVRSIRDSDETLRMKRKFEYILSHHKRLAPKQQTLGNCYQILLGAIQVMQTVEQCIGIGGPVRPWLRSQSDIVFSSHSQYPGSINTSHLSLGASSLDARYPRAPLAELPGSTPDDLAIPNVRPATRSQYLASMSSLPESTNGLTNDLAVVNKLQDLATNFSNEASNRKDTVAYHAERRLEDSFNASSTLNTVVDRIMERTQSIASTTTSIKMPYLARRYRPRPVHVPRIHSRQHSLPSELPPHQSQSSLVDDLREWIVHTAASDQFTGANLLRSPTVSSATGSIASRKEMMKMLASDPDTARTTEESFSATSDGAVTPSPPTSKENGYASLFDSKASQEISVPGSSISDSSRAASSDTASLISPADFPVPPSEPSSPSLSIRTSHQNHSTTSPRPSSETSQKPFSPATTASTSHESPSTTPSTAPLNQYHSHPRASHTVIRQPATPKQPNNPLLDKPPSHPQQPQLPPCTQIPPHNIEQPQTITSVPPPHCSPTQPAQHTSLPEASPRSQTLALARVAHAVAEGTQQSPSSTPPRSQEDDDTPPMLPPRPQKSIATTPVPVVPVPHVTTGEDQQVRRTAEERRRLAHARRMRIALGA
ncbi:hypothetical protein C7974DRAFT_121254 [Boeremia exigua]|uniref:uncharacterized protein n=1 Tax=Boeremia exigua TaxID=749465 RepID=UPI001E8E9828|nr:uncharacterized protein C7974DRAFT_121254 [Boeremia exigua]KAH6638768.1 hypothetical protein C7974DRAFT_121254 [Boeremia exigua]